MPGSCSIQTNTEGTEQRTVGLMFCADTVERLIFVQSQLPLIPCSLFPVIRQRLDCQQFYILPFPKRKRPCSFAVQCAKTTLQCMLPIPNDTSVFLSFSFVMQCQHDIKSLATLAYVTGTYIQQYHFLHDWRKLEVCQYFSLSLLASDMFMYICLLILLKLHLFLTG